ncbi:MAG: DEAD/DEAH box helicase, partial [Armatimonadetes bacterium]|nr:DEAD/DEAH box helicase [Akkermansiaceae bacterium]
ETKATDLPLDTFLSLLDSLQTLVDFTSSDWFESLKFLPATPHFELSLDGDHTRLSADLLATYPTQKLPRFEDNAVITRNFAAEASAITILGKLLNVQPSGTRFHVSDPRSIQSFLLDSLKKLPGAWKITRSPSIEKHTSSFIFVSPKIQILPSPDEWLNFDLTFETDAGATIPASEIRRLLRSKNSPSHLFKGKQIILSDDIENLVDPLFEDLDLHQENGHFIARKASIQIIREIKESLNKVLNKSDVRTYSQDIQIPSIQAKLRPYQVHGFSWLVDRLNRYQGALLADDMGLGKTLQTIACIEHLFTNCSHPAPALIVVTTSLLGNWLAEYSRFAPQRRVVTLHGSQRDKLRESIQTTDIILTTYGTLARDLAYHLNQTYSVVVIDEASLIRNPDTDHSKAVAKLKASAKIALTGTPIENSARDLWSIFRFIQPGWLGTRHQFQERYEIPLKNPETASRTSQLLRLKTSPFVLRRTKLEVAPELPSKIHINEYCELSKDQLAVYRDLLKEGRKRIDEIRDSGQAAAARMQTLTTLLRLRQTCCDLALFDSEKLKALPIPSRSAKLERLLEITEQSISAGSKILVFSQFQKQLVGIQTQLTALGIPSLRLDGQTPKRQALVDRFQSSDGPPVFLISLKAGGYGLNLTAADIVIHFDPWWNPAAEAQATDRAHRIGQTKPVTVFRLLTRNTVEEKVVQLQASKKALAESLDESLNTTDAPAWSMEDLHQLLQ